MVEAFKNYNIQKIVKFFKCSFNSHVSDFHFYIVYKNLSLVQEVMEEKKSRNFIIGPPTSLLLFMS